jgi:hypothetical protein
MTFLSLRSLEQKFCSHVISVGLFGASLPKANGGPENRPRGKPRALGQPSPPRLFGHFVELRPVIRGLAWALIAEAGWTTGHNFTEVRFGDGLPMASRR